MESMILRRVTPVAHDLESRDWSRAFHSTLRIRLDRVAGADEVAVTVNVVDTSDGGPEFMIAEVWKRERRLLA